MTDYQNVIDLLMPGVAGRAIPAGLDWDLRQVEDDIVLTLNGHDHLIATQKEIESGEYKALFKARVSRAIDTERNGAP